MLQWKEIMGLHYMHQSQTAFVFVWELKVRKGRFLVCLSVWAYLWKGKVEWMKMNDGEMETVCLWWWGEVVGGGCFQSLNTRFQRTTVHCSQRHRHYYLPRYAVRVKEFFFFYLSFFLVSWGERERGFSFSFPLLFPPFTF